MMDKNRTNGEELQDPKIGPDSLRTKPVKIKVVDKRFWARKGQAPEDIPADASAFDERSLQPAYVQELETKYQDAMRKVDDLVNAYRTLKSEQANFKARIEKQRQHYIFDFKKNFFNKILDIIDNFERALAAAKTSESVDAIVTGIHLILTQFEKTLESEGLTRIEPVGEIYDPATSEVVDVQPTSNPDENHHVIEVVQPGYSLEGLLLRPCRVRVKRYEAPSGSDSDSDTPGSAKSQS